MYAWPSVPARNRSSHSADSAGIARGSSNAASLPTLTMIASSDEAASPSTASSSGPA
jgi:hypothetical protein